MSSGTAILSLDCEGKWGVADHLTPEFHKGLTDERLRWAYREIADLLRRHEVNATFAFVELFTRSVQEQRAAGIDDLARELPYLRDAARAIGSNEEGWSGPWALDMIGPRNEIAFHGYTHVPWSNLTRDQARRELSLTPKYRRQTMVFPRNDVAHLDVLAEFSCVGFRGAKRSSSRLASFLTEFDVLPYSDNAASSSASTIEIGAGIYINWRRGGRRLVPVTVTRLRARNLLIDAGRTGGAAHFWLHPENVATHPATLANVVAVIEEIAHARSRGLIEVRTQIDH